MQVGINLWKLHSSVLAYQRSDKRDDSLSLSLSLFLSLSFTKTFPRDALFERSSQLEARVKSAPLATRPGNFGAASRNASDVGVT